jgi:hypothetical protein
MRYLIAIFVVAIAVSAGVGQSVDVKSDAASPAEAIGANRYESKFSLLDPSRFSMTHSYTLSYFSVGGHGQTLGLYVNSMRYQLSKSLDLGVALGWLHQPSQVFSRNDRGVTNYGTILPNVQLLYHPSEKFRFLISFESLPGGYAGGRQNPFWPLNPAAF